LCCNGCSLRFTSAFLACFEASKSLFLFFLKIFLSLIFLFKFILESFDVSLKGLFLELMISLKSKDLIVGLL